MVVPFIVRCVPLRSLSFGLRSRPSSKSKRGEVNVDPANHER